MDEYEDNFKPIFKKKSKDKLKLILYFWDIFILMIFCSLIIYSFFWFSTDTVIKNASLYLGSILLIMLPLLIEYPKVSKKAHIKIKRLTMILVIVFILLSFILLYYYSYVEEYFLLNKLYLPFITLIAIPLTLDLLRKLLENKPPNVQILFHDKSKMSNISSGIKEWYYYDLPHRIKKQGLPIFIKNNSNQSIIISNIRLEILDVPFIVPSSSARRICRLKSKKYKWIYLYHDYSLGSLIVIQPKEGKSLYIPQKELMVFYKKINQMEEPFSRIIQPMYVTAIDSFNLNEYSSEKIYYPTVNLYFFSVE